MPQALTYKECKVGTHVAVSDAAELRAALEPFEEDDAGTQALEPTVARFAGRRGVITSRAKNNLELLERMGRLGVALVDGETTAEALLPVDVLFVDEVELKLKHERELRLAKERELARGQAAETIQQTWPSSPGSWTARAPTARR